MYPFEESVFALDKHARDPEFAKRVRSQFDLHYDALIDRAVSHGLGKVTAEWVVEELVSNATQYGRSSKQDAAAGVIRMEWLLDKDGAEPTLALAVANPCVNLFDPSKFARMEMDRFLDLEKPETNGHLGTIALLGYAKKDTKVVYLWELASGERIKLTMERIPEDAPDRPSNYDDLMRPTRVEVFKFDANNQQFPYSFDQFQRDVEGKVPAESVTVSCVISASSTSVKTEEA
jgi:hypothetical protein